MTERAVRVWVRGRVQGVGFRLHVLERATALGLSGWVRNLPDGRVEAHLQGRPVALESMCAWCRSGPPHARVERVEELGVALEACEGFQIRRG